MRRSSSWILFTALSLRSPRQSFAQTFGQITGMVTDTTGGVLVGATVTVTNTQTGATVTQQANSAGLYVFPNLLPGIFDVRVEMNGFRSAARNRIELQIVIDTSAVRNLHLGPTNVQFRIEPFNLLNQPNFGDPNLNLAQSNWNVAGANRIPTPGGGAFGTINETRATVPMRQLQCALK